MTRFRPTLVAATLALSLAGGLAGAATLRVANQGDAHLDGPALAERVTAADRSPTTSTSPWSSRDKQARSCAGAWPPSWKQTAPTVWRFELRRNVQASTTARTLSADDVVFSLRPCGRRGLGHEELHLLVQAGPQGGRSTRWRWRPLTPFPILPDVISLVYVMNKKWCEDNKADGAGRSPKGHREHRLVQVPTAPARTA
jgi:peptide/nickel transport system substrate-binding protein